MDNFAKHLMVAIPIFNRIDFLKLMISTLKQARGFQNATVRFYNDASTEFSAEDIQNIVPEYAEVIDWPTNSGGADFAVYMIFQDFLARDEGYLLVIDSDMLLSGGALEFCASHVDETEGILSLFNTKNHESCAESGVFLEKKSIGFAGTLWTKALIRRIIHLEAGPNLDWRICDFLNRDGIRILCSKASQLQHIGYIGQNSRVSNFDYGIGFFPDTPAASQALIETSERIILGTLDAVEQMQSKLKRNIRILRLLSAGICVLLLLLFWSTLRS